MKSITVAAFALLAGCSPAKAGILTAAPDTLGSVMARAIPGDRISLAPGNYGDVVISARKFPKGVTLGCADEAHPASFRTLTIKGSSNLAIECASVDFTPDASTVSWSSAIQIANSDHVTLRNMRVQGGNAITGVEEAATKLDNTGNVIGRPSGRGMTISGSSGILIEGLDISHFHRGIVLAGVQDVTIRRSDLHDMRTTAIVGSNMSDVTVEENQIHDAHPWHWGAGDHADFIAFWSDANQTTPNARVKILNNRISQSDGLSVLGMWFQGKPAAPFTDAVISGNTFLLGNLQGIALWHTQGATIEHNVMRRTGDDPKQAPGILLREGSAKVSMTGNTLNLISDTSGGDNSQKANLSVSGKVDPKAR